VGIAEDAVLSTPSHFWKPCSQSCGSVLWRAVYERDSGIGAEDMNPSRHSEWADLPEVYLRLEKDEDGYPSKMWEALRAERLADPNSYRIKSVPFYAKEIAYEDEVRTTTSSEGYFPVFEQVTKRSGFSTVRLWLEESEDKNALVDFFTVRGCLLEFELNNRLVALAIPERTFESVSAYICKQKDRGRWDAQDGHLILGE
jgi:hypothetical protein